MKKNVAQKISVSVLGIIAVLLIIEMCLRLGGLIFVSRQDKKNVASLGRLGVYKIMCLGESTTALGGALSWPSQLENILNSRGMSTKFSVINRGFPSINSSYIIANIEGNLDKYRPDMVVAMMGMNDRENTTIYTSFPIKTYKLVKLLVGNIASKIDGLKKEEKERALIEAVKNNPGKAEAWTKFGWYYKSLNDCEKAEQAFEKALKSDPSYEMAYFEIAQCYKEQGRYDDAASALERILDINPGNNIAYMDLGRLFRAQGKPDKAEKIFARALALNPANVEPLMELGRCFIQQKKYGMAEQTFKKAVQLNPAHDGAYFELGLCYEKQEKYRPAIEMFEKSVEINPSDPMNAKSYFELAGCFGMIGEYGKAEQIIKRVAGQNPSNDRVYDELARLYDKMGKKDEALAARVKADEMRLASGSTMTRRNYRELKQVLDKRGIKLVCVQYPTRPVGPLKDIMAEYKDVVFVDNEGSFKEAVNRESYDEYFTDACYIDFGHGTPKGNRLLAQNVADAILASFPELK